MEADKHASERLIAGELLSMMAGRLSENFLKFSTWLIAAFTAILSFTIANFEKTALLVTAPHIRAAIVIYLTAFAIHVVQRYLATAMAGSVAAGVEAKALTKDNSGTLDFVVINEEMKRAVWGPGKWMLDRTLEKLRRGDLSAVGRMHLALAQTQGALVVLQAILLGTATYVLVA